MKHKHLYKNRFVVIREIIRKKDGPFFSLPGSASVKSKRLVCSCGKLKSGGYAGREDWHISIY